MNCKPKFEDCIVNKKKNCVTDKCFINGLMIFLGFLIFWTFFAIFILPKLSLP